MTEDTPVRPDTIQYLANVIYEPMALKAGMRLGLFTPLKDGPMTAEALAAETGANPDRLALLLYALVAIGLLTEAGGEFANSAESDRYLVKGLPTYMGSQHFLYDELWEAAMMSADTLLEGAPKSKHDFARMTEDELAGFYRGTHSGALAAGRRLAELVDLSAARRLVDVGGGSGGVAMGLCETNPELHATIAEFASVTPITRSIVAEAGMDSRIDVIDADIVAEPPEGAYDAAVLRNLIQVLSAPEAAATIAHVGQAVEPGGRIHIWGWMLDNSRHTPRDSALHNLVFLNMYDHGQAYSEAEHFGWLDAAGFVAPERRVLPGGFGLISARKE